VNLNGDPIIFLTAKTRSASGRFRKTLPRGVPSLLIVIYVSLIQGYRKRWTGFETAITLKVLDGFTRLAS